ncbi:MAG: hypothetical protein HGA67_02440 [Candidatus Yonathbacteria bacterium]|nr:hypothetical protein [Candidatus Yonathbacteria bacterium]
MSYRKVLRPIFFSLPPRVMHTLMTVLGERLGLFAPIRTLISSVWGYRGADITKTIDGIRYERPVLLSAGFDCDGRLTHILPSIALGGEEVGSVTALPCEGATDYGYTRLVRNKSIIVFKGLRNRGVDNIITRLQSKKRVKNFVVGISIASTNNAQISNEDEALQDYVTTFRKLNDADVGDYYTINISCPNAYKGETFANPQLLPKLITALQTIPTTKPVYFKMPINLEWPAFNELLAIIANSPYQGVVIGNLNKDYTSLDYPEDAPSAYAGGLSGKPCAILSNELIRKTREAYGERLTIIGTGGIFSGNDAMEKFDAGADLVQLITGIIFEGPGLVKEICQTYANEYRAGR